jgi:hypothetical protein
MLQVGGDADFAKEPLRAQRGGELGPDDLDGDLAIVLEVVSQEHDRHSTTPELPVERVLTSQAVLQPRAEVGQLGSSVGRKETE